MSYHRDYWLHRCEGFRVDSPRGRLGIVEELRFRSNAERATTLVAGGLQFVITALTVVAGYAVYSVIPSTLQRHGGRSFALTVPFVILGVARYIRLVYRRGGGGSPTRALLIDDPWLLLIVLAWVLAAGWIIYGS